MLNKPAQVWLLFLLCIVLVVPAMGWLTVKILQQDQIRENDRVDTELARQETELQDLINRALYRMDWKLSPIIAREAARPHYLYNSFYNPKSTSGFSGSGSDSKNQSDDEQLLPSPLLDQQSEFVKLYFQVSSDNQFTSPQMPASNPLQDRAFVCSDLTPDLLVEKKMILDKAKSFTNFGMINRNAQAPVADNSSNATQNGVFRNLDFAEVQPQQLRAAKDNQVRSKTEVQQRNNDVLNVNEFNRRQTGTGNYANSWALDQNKMLSRPAREGVMSPFWIDDELFLARRVDIDGDQIVQCCWLDWPKIRDSLQAEVSDILPDIKFESITDDEPDYRRALATLPVQLVVDKTHMLANLALEQRALVDKPQSGLRLAMIAAWCGLGLATCATAGLLFGVMKLSERRASFVSAVTHELRTPLTTFRMYSEMLADKMVPPEKQQHYALTLQKQADRLTHLVDNVLQFARLEKDNSQARKESMTCRQLFERFEGRLQQRCDYADMELSIEFEDDADELEMLTDASSVEQIVFNLVDNACKYAKGADDNRIDVHIRHNRRAVRVSVRDYGPGVDDQFRRRMFQPFCKSDIDAANSAPGVGLGLALCKRMAHSMGGSIHCESSQQGATFVLSLPQE